MAGGNGDNFGLTDADLLAWVEGEALPRDRAALVAAAMHADAALARRLTAMRSDRAILTTMPEPAAPPGLVEAAEAHLERRMLLGLEQGEPISDHLPVSIVRPRRRSPLRFVLSAARDHPIGGRLALAAGLLLMIGGAAYLASISLTGLKFGGAQAPRVAGGGPASPAPLPTEVASARGPETPHAGETSPAPGEATVAMTDPVEAAPAAPPISPADAVALARMNRLVIRVRAADPETAAGRIARAADKVAHSSAPWRLSKDAPGEVIAAVTPRGAGDLTPRPPAAPASPTIADAVPTRERPIVPPGAPAPVIRLPEFPSFVYVLCTPADSGALEHALRTLTDGTSQTAEFVETDRPIPPMPPVLTANSVLWWSHGAASWQQWVGVPVVVGK